MRLAYLISQYPASSHTFIRREVDAVRRRGLSVETFSIRRPSDDELSAAEDRASFETTFYVLPVRPGSFCAAHVQALVSRPLAYLKVLRLSLRHRAPGLRALVWSVLHFAESIILAREFKRRRITHIHNHFANAGANVGLLATQFLGLPWSLTLHGISETDYPAGLLLAAKIEYAEFVACVSWFGRAQAMRITPPDHWHKLFVMRCGLDMKRFDRADSGRADPAGQLRIICVGRLSAEKGHLGLLEAFAGLRGRVDAHLVLVGDGPERRLIEQRCSELGLSEHTTFAGRLAETDTLREIARSDLLVLPSLMEGLPVVLMEAMAAGVPVIAPHVAGIPELVEDGRTGLLFRPSDWTQLEEAMLSLLTDGDARARLASAGRAKVACEFEVERAVAPLIERLGPDGASDAGGPIQVTSPEAVHP